MRACQRKKALQVSHLLKGSIAATLKYVHLRKSFSRRFLAMPATRTSIKQRLHDLGETDASKSTVFFEKALTKACCSFFKVGRHSKDAGTAMLAPSMLSRLLQEKDRKRLEGMETRAKRLGVKSSSVRAVRAKHICIVVWPSFSVSQIVPLK